MAEVDGGYNVLLLQEDLANGQCVAAFTVETGDDDNAGSAPLAKGTTIGQKRLLKLKTPLGKGVGRLKVTVTDTVGGCTPAVSKVGLLRAPKIGKQN